MSEQAPTRDHTYAKGQTLSAVRPSWVRQVVVGAAFLGAVAAVAALGSWATIPHTDGWYAEANKVAWSPPNWLFGPAWSTLYLMIAVSGFLIWRAGFAGQGQANRARSVLWLFVLQLLLNLAWTPLFFALFPQIGAVAWWLALVDIIVLIGAVALLVGRSWPWSKVSSLLLGPYLGWLLFASSLNIGVIALN